MSYTPNEEQSKLTVLIRARSWFRYKIMFRILNFINSRLPFVVIRPFEREDPLLGYVCLRKTYIYNMLYIGNREYFFTYNGKLDGTGTCLRCSPSEHGKAKKHQCSFKVIEGGKEEAD